MGNPVTPLIHLFSQVAVEGNAVPDSELLRRYAEQQDEAAFELLLWRHGGMIWGVCQRIAPDHAAAEDAFQATAIALVRNAARVRAAHSVAGWIYRVASRAALAARTRRKETPCATFPDRPAADSDPASATENAELARLIDEEVRALPEQFRSAFVLCELEGRSNAEAAAVLGCAVGTVESRLTRTRRRLRERLSRRGVAFTCGVLVAGQVPQSIQAAALRAASDPASASPPVRDLAVHAAGRAGSGHLRAAGLILAGLGALAVGLATATESLPSLAKPAAERRTLAPAPALPAEFARLGSTRFRHPHSVFHSAFTADGKTLATVSLGSVSVWETATGKLLRRIERAGVPFHRVAFTADGKTLYAVAGPTEDGCELLTFDPESGKQRSKMVIRKRIYKGAEFSPDATRLAVFPMWESAEAILIDPATTKELARVPGEWRGNAFTPDGKRLILAGGNEVVRMIDATTGKETSKLEPKERRPEWVRFTPSGVVLLASHGWVERWDPKRNASVWKADFLPTGRGMEVSPDGARVAHVSPFGVTAFDVETGKKLFQVRDDYYSSARFSPDGKTLALSCASGVVALRDATSGKTLAQSPDLSGMVSGLTFSEDGKQLIAVAGEHWVKWDLAASVPNPQPRRLAEFDILAPGSRIAVRSDAIRKADTPVEFVDAATGKRISLLDPRETSETVVISRADQRGGKFSADGRRFVGFRLGERGPGGQQAELGLAVWDVATGKRTAKWQDGRALAFAAAVSPDGKAVAVLSAGPHRLAVWEPDTGRTRWTCDLGNSVPFVTFAKGGSWVVLQEIHPAAPPRDGFNIPRTPGPFPLRVLDSVTGKEIRMVLGPAIGDQPWSFLDDEFYPTPNARAVARDGRALALSGYDGTIYLWDLAADREQSKLVHPGPVHDLAFSPDGKTLAAASLAGPVVVYDLTGKRKAAHK